MKTWSWLSFSLVLFMFTELAWGWGFGDVVKTFVDPLGIANPKKAAENVQKDAQDVLEDVQYIRKYGPAFAVAKKICTPGFKQYVASVKNACVYGHSSVGDSRISTAIDFLVNKGIYTREEFDGVQFIKCGYINEFTFGMVPATNVVLLATKNDFNDGTALTSLIAHEMVHINQIRRWGFGKFSAEYCSQVTTKFSFERGNRVEDEAYNFEDQIQSIIEKSEPSVTSSSTRSNSAGSSSSGWMDAFNKYQETVSIPAPNGFVIKSAPSLNASIIKVKNGYADMDMAGHIDIDGQKFYMTEWSWNQYNKGNEPTWAVLLSSSKNWSNSFNQYQETVSISAPNGFIMKSAPSLDASTIKVNNEYSDMDMAGHIEVDGTTFYMTQYSWQQYQKGKKPNWVILK